MALDFSKLRAIKYQGDNSEKQRTTGEELLSKGFTCIGDKTPFSTAPEAVSAPQRATLAAPETIPLSATETATAPAAAPQKRVKEALILKEIGVNISELLRDIFEFMAKYSTPVVNEEYWRSNPDAIAEPPDECEYWERAREDYEALGAKYIADIYTASQSSDLGNILSYFYSILIEENYAKRRRIKATARADREKASRN